MSEIFQKKGKKKKGTKNVKKGQKGQSIKKFGQKCTKFENIFNINCWET